MIDSLTDAIVDVFTKENRTPTKYDGDVIWAWLANNALLYDGEDVTSSFRGNGGMIAEALNILNEKTSYDYLDFYCQEALAEDIIKMQELFEKCGYVFDSGDGSGNIDTHYWLNRWPTEEEKEKYES